MYKLSGLVILCFAFASTNALSPSQQAVIYEAQNQLESMNLSPACLKQTTDEINQIKSAHDLCGVENVGTAECADNVIDSVVQIFLLVQKCMDKSPLNAAVCATTGAPKVIIDLINTCRKCFGAQSFLEATFCSVSTVNRNVLQKVIDNAHKCSL